MGNDFYYYITKSPYDNLTQKSSNIPVILKMKKSQFPIEISLTDKNQGEGPFNCLFELKKRSLIFNSIKSQKLKDRISKSKNIKEIEDFIFTNLTLTTIKLFLTHYTTLL